MDELVDAFYRMRKIRGRPKVLICDTVMGKGVPFLERREKAHFIRVDSGEWDRALHELQEVQY